jgi:hypothetical protein
MDKNLRRKDFEVKKHHGFKEKGHRKEKEELIDKESEQLEFGTLEELRVFMEEQYEDMAQRNPETLNRIHKLIFKELLRFREEWIQSHKTYQVNHFRGMGVEMNDKLYK